MDESPAEKKRTTGAGSTPLYVALIFALGLLAYSNTFGAPFQFDDMVVTESARFKNVSNVPSMFVDIAGPWASRPLVHATMAVNHYLGGMDTAGYHAANIAMHLINGLLLYLLVLATGKRLGHGDEYLRPAAALSAALFVLHPLQTEAVTLIVSRSVLLAATSCLAGLLLFMKAVTSERKRGLYLAGLLIVSLMGAGAREDFAVFPAMLFLYDLFFISKFRLRETAGHYRAYLTVAPGIGYLAYLALNNTYGGVVDYPSLNVHHADYALTQFRAHWTYLRLLALPVGQNLDYDYPVSKALFDPPTIASLAGYLGLWAGGFLLARKRPLTAFAVLWFLVALMPVSFGVTFFKSIPLGDVMFEHRLYLPGAAFFALAAAGTFRAREMLGTGKRKALAISLSVLLVVTLGAATFARNTVWGSETGLWEDVVAKSPGKARGHYNLANGYAAKGLTAEAEEHYLASLRIEPGYAKAHNNLGFIYLYKKGDIDSAIEHYEASLRLDPGSAKAHLNLGIAYKKKGFNEKASEHLGMARQLEPSLFGF